MIVINENVTIKKLKGLNCLNRKKWQIILCDKDLAAQIAEDHNMNPFVALLAASRGINNEIEISDYFMDQGVALSNPFDLPDMKKAVDRLNIAIDNDEHIIIFGDYDADGVTATVLLKSYLEARGACVSHYIPDRQTEGYGLSEESVGVLKDMGAQLIVTVDNGVSAIDESQLVADMGMDLIITDHHKPKTKLPRAIAVVDPHREDSICEYKDFAGVGVVFKLICALDEGEPEELLGEFGDLLAIGTIGDIVPLTGENRRIVKQGIAAINYCPRIGIKALLKAAGVGEKKISSSSIAFILAPRINAAGRMGSANRAVELLLTEDETLSGSLATEINNENILRRKIEEEITAKVEEQLELLPIHKFDRVIVADGYNLHNGVIGIVASRMVQKYGRPCIIISRDKATAKGSGRSIEGFSLYDALNSVSDCLIRFGGHPLAAGLEISNDRIDEFRKAINEYASRIIMPFPIQRIDLKINPKSISTDAAGVLEVFEPYGEGNPQPIFGLFGMKIETVQPVSEGKHTRIKISKGDSIINAIIFNAITAEFKYYPNDIVDLAVIIENSDYKDSIIVNTRIVDMRLAGLNEDKILTGIRVYEQFKRGERLTQLQYESSLPDRDLFSAIYRNLKNQGGRNHDLEKQCMLVNDDGGKITAIMIVFDVFLEFNLINKLENGGVCLNPVDNKVNLDKSCVLRRLKDCCDSLEIQMQGR